MQMQMQKQKHMQMALSSFPCWRNVGSFPHLDPDCPAMLLLLLSLFLPLSRRLSKPPRERGLQGCRAADHSRQLIRQEPTRLSLTGIRNWRICRCYPVSPVGGLHARIVAHFHFSRPPRPCSRGSVHNGGIAAKTEILTNPTP